MMNMSRLVYACVSTKQIWPESCFETARQSGQPREAVRTLELKTGLKTHDNSRRRKQEGQVLKGKYWLACNAILSFHLYENYIMQRFSIARSVKFAQQNKLRGLTQSH